MIKSHSFFLLAWLVAGAFLVGCQPKIAGDGNQVPSSIASAQAEVTKSPSAQASAQPSPRTSIPIPQATPLPEGASPLKGLPDRSAPKLTEVVKVKVQTTSGDLTIAVYPQAAPHAAERFLTLVSQGFYNDTPISRVVTEPEPFVAQFGINHRMPEWQQKNFDDDPTYFSLEKGTLCFAKAGPNTNSTQVFINLGENNFLTDPKMNFTVFGKVEEGLPIVDKFLPTGDPGLDQGRLWTDPNYLDSVPNKPTMIVSMSFL